MAGISYSNSGGLNPTSKYMPYRNGGIFSDSPYLIDGSNFGSTKLGSYAGFYGDFTSSLYFMGEEDSNAYINVNSASAIIRIVSDSLQLTGALTSATAGAHTGQHLVLTINGNIKKIALLNP
jgi:hypothetical protein